MRHLTPENYIRQPWKNGRGSTTELWRLEREGRLLVRLSRAAVVEDGPFSVFPGIERNLTVLSGPGFRLTGAGLDFRCEPLVPVAFPGDIEVMATETNGQQSDDFNVMTARSLPRPEVILAQNDDLPAGGTLALYALGPCLVNGEGVNRDDLILTEGPARLQGDWPVIAVRLSGLS
ncbi:MAG: HutD family protein [Alphaproteobacteria bacterium]